MNTELLMAAKSAIRSVELILPRVLPEEMKALKRLITRIESDMEREVMWYQYQYDNSQNEYHKGMIE